jgi:hypothetical protein
MRYVMEEKEIKLLDEEAGDLEEIRICVKKYSSLGHAWNGHAFVNPYNGSDVSFVVDRRLLDE